MADDKKQRPLVVSIVGGLVVGLALFMLGRLTAKSDADLQALVRYGTIAPIDLPHWQPTYPNGFQPKPVLGYYEVYIRNEGDRAALGVELQIPEPVAVRIQPRSGEARWITPKAKRVELGDLAKEDSVEVYVAVDRQPSRSEAEQVELTQKSDGSSERKVMEWSEPESTGVVAVALKFVPGFAVLALILLIVLVQEWFSTRRLKKTGPFTAPIEVDFDFEREMRDAHDYSLLKSAGNPILPFKEWRLMRDAERLGYEAKKKPPEPEI